MEEVNGSTPLCSTNLLFKNSDTALLLGAAVLGFCPDFKLEAFKRADFSI
jgi:hypothetical protein